MSLHFVTGKGGVGKTRVALLLAQRFSQAVLAETSRGLKDEADRIDVSPPPIFRFDRTDLAEEFLISTVKIRAIAHWLSRSSLFQTLLSLAPNLHELLLVKKWVEICGESPVIVDAPSTGHFLAIFDAIETAQKVFDGGSLKSIANEVDGYLRTEEIHIHIVAIPERSALLEMNEIEDHLRRLYPNFKIHRILNRKHSDPAPTLLPELMEFAKSRKRSEDRRVENITFENQIDEGTHSL